MNIMDLINPILAIGSMGLVFGVGLGIASKKFAVPVDEKVEAVKTHLPGANCGGCGFAGCDAFAKAVVDGRAKSDGCPVNNQEATEKIATIMGVQITAGIKQSAQVKCLGTCEVAKEKYHYEGVEDCQSAHLLHGGLKKCAYGCLGLGSCVKACPFDAITIQEGLAHVNQEKCRACSLCVSACPRALIVVEKIKNVYTVKCHSHDKGKDVKSGCSRGCIGCGICAKQCDEDAITIKNNLAWIDPERCTGCGKCAEKCPTHVIEKI